MGIIALLEDEAGRTEVMSRILAADHAEHQAVIIPFAIDFIPWLEANLDACVLLSLDHDLGPSFLRDGERVDPGDGRDVSNYLATRDPVCPVIVHTSNSKAAPSMEFTLTHANWSVTRVVPYSDLEWVEAVWRRTLRELLP